MCVSFSIEPSKRMTDECHPHQIMSEICVRNSERWFFSKSSTADYDTTNVNESFYSETPFYSSGGSWQFCGKFILYVRELCV